MQLQIPCYVFNSRLSIYLFGLSTIFCNFCSSGSCIDNSAVGVKSSIHFQFLALHIRQTDFIQKVGLLRGGGNVLSGKAFSGTSLPVSSASRSALNHPWRVNQGRLVPSTSVDQYAATLARWFGVEAQEMANVLPNINRFGTVVGRGDYPTDLGFLKP